MISHEKGEGHSVFPKKRPTEIPIGNNVLGSAPLIIFEKSTPVVLNKVSSLCLNYVFCFSEAGEIYGFQLPQV